MTPPRVGIESPLKSGDFATNQRYARWCMYDSLLRGEAPFASHLLYTQVLYDGSETQREMGISAGESFYDACDFRAFYVDLPATEQSSGMRRAWRRSQLRWQPFWHLLRAAFRVLWTPTRAVARRLPTPLLLAFEAGKEPSDIPAGTFESSYHLARATRNLSP
jgi:hypothetical protein